MNQSKCTLHIDTRIIQNNYNLLKNMCNSPVGVAIKANAYGLGAEYIAPALEKSGCKDFFVSCCDEGIKLRKILGPKINIYVLHGVFKNELELFTEYNLIPILNHLAQIELWQNYALKLNIKLPCILHIDTGMHRLGMSETEIETLNIKKDMFQLNILYIMSHLSSAEDINNPSNQKQLNLFKQYSAKFSGIKRSLANSSGIFLSKDYHFDLARSGAAVYGINPAPYLEDSGIKSPIKLLAPIIQLASLPPNATIGYNGTYKNIHNKNLLIATIPVGYADGFPRIFSNKGTVYIKGFEAPIVGRVSMDLITIDVSNIPTKEIFLGAPVELIGENCTADKLSQIARTNGYEILTMLGDRYERIYS